MPIVILIRHAASSGQSSDAPLTEEGHRQAHDLTKTLTHLNPDALYTSPFRRARQTIQPFAKASGMTINSLNDLHERILSPAPVPDWLTRVERSFDNREHALPGGESMNETYRRAEAALSFILATGAKRAVAVSHGNLIASVLHRIDSNFGFTHWKAMQNPDLFEIHFTDLQPTSFSIP